MSTALAAKTAPEPAAAETILAVNNIEVIYDHVMLVLKGVSLSVPRGGIVAILDGNAAIRRDVEMIYDYFPRLRQRRGAMAGYTSGGEQQMCAIGRAMMSRPKMILLDEPSMGLAPQIVEEIYEIVRKLNVTENVSFLLAEQNTNMALKYANYGYILETGRVVMDGPAKSLRENEDVKEFYLGIAEGSKKSFRAVKSYKRRKRWLA